MVPLLSILSILLAKARVLEVSPILPPPIYFEFVPISQKSVQLLEEHSMSSKTDQRPWCDCCPSRPTTVFTSRTKKNPFRRFYGCAGYPAGCKFMEWLDEKFDDRMQLEIVQLMNRVEAAENKALELELKHGVEVRELREKVAGLRGKLQQAKEVERKLHHFQQNMLSIIVGFTSVLLGFLVLYLCCFM